jgi:two-component system cell cycle response regulator DivK
MLILIAEDNPDNRSLLERRLERKGWPYAIALDGVEAVEQCRALKPDLVLMDLAMPRMSGLEATRILKGDPETCAIKIIAVTAHAMEANRAECIEAGCDGYATKPVEFAALFALIRETLGARCEGLAA